MTPTQEDHEAAARRIIKILTSEYMEAYSWARAEGVKRALTSAEALIAAALSEAVRVAVEACAKAVCAVCGGGSCSGMTHDSVARRGVGGDWTHEVRNVDGGSWLIPCAAGPIFELRSDAQPTPAPEEKAKQPNPCSVCGAFLWGDLRPCWNCKRLAMLGTPPETGEK